MPPNVKLPMLITLFNVEPLLLLRLTLFAPLAAPMTIAPDPVVIELVPVTTIVPKVTGLLEVLIALFNVVALAVLVMPPLKLKVSAGALPNATPLVFKKVAALVNVLLDPFNATAYGCAKVVRPASVTLPLKVTAPFALVLFCKINVCPAPLKLLPKVIAPLPPFTVAPLFKLTGPLKLIAPPAEITLAASWITPVPAGVTLIALAPEVCTGPLIIISELPAFSVKVIVPAAFTVAPEAI